MFDFEAINDLLKLKSVPQSGIDALPLRCFQISKSILSVLVALIPIHPHFQTDVIQKKRRPTV
jgi:hypothetical protein